MTKPSNDKAPYRLFQLCNRIPELLHFPEKTRFEIWQRANTAIRLGCVATALLFA